MRPQLSIAEVHPGSTAAAVALLQAQMQKHEIATSPDALRSVIERVIYDARHGFILLAAADGKPVGVAFAAAHLSAEHGGVIGWLEELYVTPDARGSGVGSALLTETVSRARTLGWRALELEVVAGHERAVPLYARHEFTLTARTRFTRVF